ncbi:hypothetical protein TGAMA5MH_06434 [Trichoderma gamsii]|uniref:Ecp2 effector protein domain-containing protein n=1 Tax=Trichoderma gamsii TaxID=398673 RepID=A0A2K0T7Z6_9HYPO|nr:hypothetical protein TGAMA5MH_06434 [Trichoderma gamsii]
MVLFRFLVLLLSVIACAATASQSQGGIAVEQGLPDGIYQAVAVQGPTLEAPTTIPPAVPSGHLSPRRWKSPPGQGDFYEKPGPHTVDDYSVPIHANRHSCHKDRDILLNSTEYRRAVDNLWDYCQNFKVPFHGAHFSIVGDVMVYVCTYSVQRPCHRHEWNEAEEIMDKKCGQGKGSHVQMSKRMMEYGRAYAGKRVCASSNLASHIAWKAQPLPVLANGQILGHWKAGPPRNKTGDSQYKAEDDGGQDNKTDNRKRDMAEGDGKNKKKTG